MTQNEDLLEASRDSLNEILEPFQKEVNRSQKLVEFIKQCTRCADRDDFLRLDELLHSPLVRQVREQPELEACTPSLTQLKAYADQQVQRYRYEFIDDLRGRAAEADLPLEVDFPRFKSLVGIEGAIDFAARTTVINKKTLKSIDPRRIISAILKLKRTLYDGRYDPQAFIDGLFATYAANMKRKGKKIGTDSVPAQEFYLEHVLAQQSKPFFSNMEKGRFRGYSLDQFSVDLWRYYQAGIGGTRDGYALKLRPGRNNALWLFDREGERRQISNISFQEYR